MEPAVIAMGRLTVCGVKQTRFYFFIFWLLDHGHAFVPKRMHSRSLLALKLQRRQALRRAGTDHESRITIF